MRLAMVTFYPQDPGLIPGGIRMVAYNLVEALRAYGDLELHVIHCHSDIAQDALVRDGPVTVHYLAPPRRRVLPNLITGVGRMVRALRAIRPDLVHAHAAHMAYAGVKAGYPTIYTIHGVLPRERQVYSRTLYDRWRYGLLALYEAYALRHVQRAVAISPYVLQEYGQVESARWVRINNPVPPVYFALPNRAEAGRILYAGSITEIKDLLTLIRAVERLRAMEPKVTLRIAGRATSADYERKVRAWVRAHQLEDVVHFLGLLGREALWEEYARCAVVALSSVQENAPMTISEAMAAAKPVVATRVGGVPDLVQEGETGFLVPVGDDAALAERLRRILTDPALAERLGRRGRELARERFSAEQVARQYYALYGQVLREWRRARPDAGGTG